MVGANGQSSSDSSQPASFPTATNGVSFDPGETQPTGRSLDFAIQGSGFFQVQMPDGSTAYTRNGSFSERSDGTLVNSSNYPVLGGNGSPIVLAQAAGPVTVTQDGAISQGENSSKPRSTANRSLRNSISCRASASTITTPTAPAAATFACAAIRATTFRSSLTVFR